jgi:mersacidin/lichenicidin family type 2 lantibiotic
MNTENIIRAWKDEGYRLSLSTAERVLLPDNPAGLIELTDADLEHIAGGKMNTATNCLTRNINCYTASQCKYPW